MAAVMKTSGLAGLLTGAVALGIAELTAAVTGPNGAPVTAVGESPAQLAAGDIDTWRQWRQTWNATPGVHQLQVRASARPRAAPAGPHRRLRAGPPRLVGVGWVGLGTSRRRIRGRRGHGLRVGLLVGAEVRGGQLQRHGRRAGRNGRLG